MLLLATTAWSASASASWRCCWSRRAAVGAVALIQARPLVHVVLHVFRVARALLGRWLETVYDSARELLTWPRLALRWASASVVGRRVPGAVRHLLGLGAEPAWNCSTRPRSRWPRVAWSARRRCCRWLGRPRAPSRPCSTWWPSAARRRRRRDAAHSRVHAVVRRRARRRRLCLRVTASRHANQDDWRRAALAAARRRRARMRAFSRCSSSRSSALMPGVGGGAACLPSSCGRSTPNRINARRS